MAVPGGAAGMKKAGESLAVGPQTIIEANFSSAFATVYLLVVSAAIFVCCMSIMTSTVRLGFGMSRDNQLPLLEGARQGEPAPAHADRVVRRRRAGRRHPVPAVRRRDGDRGRGHGDDLPLYFLGNLAFMRARAKGWPKTKAPFSLGRWGTVVNVLGLLWGGAMLINFLWFSNNEEFGLRWLTNPKATQTDYFGTGQLVNFHIGFLNDIPVIELVMVTIVVIGAIYFFAAQRSGSYTVVVPPDQEETVAV